MMHHAGQRGAVGCHGVGVQFYGLHLEPGRVSAERGAASAGKQINQGHDDAE
tara:strand:+ start:65 stop:220 length:156 start_codon:yes stop_codon:yes gene_type:complete